jgi:DNA primase
VIAPLGTALTSDQAALLRRYAPSAILLYDSDRAGLRATFRAGDELLRQGMRVRVATLPPGEDPDTLVRAGGAAALESIVRDAVDVLERKIQLLERKGWFHDVEHQRAALDRLLPTIRAAADPITRDLYLKIVSERSGVSREVLQQQVAAKPARQPEPVGAQRRIAGVGPGRPEIRPRMDPTERALLRVLARHPEWLKRAIAEVPSEWLETPALRELYDAMRSSPENVGTGVFLDQLSPSAQRAWADLDAIDPQYGQPDPDVTYVSCVRQLEVRPLQKELEELDRRMGKKIPADQYDSLVKERNRLLQEITARSPDESRKRYIRRANLDAR